MKIRIEYSKTQLDECVKFISDHNLSFQGRESYIRDSILSNVRELANKFPDGTFISTMGYSIQAFVESMEGIDEDVNVLRLEFMVDPAVSMDYEYATEDIEVIQK